MSEKSKIISFLKEYIYKQERLENKQDSFLSLFKKYFPNEFVKFYLSLLAEENLLNAFIEIEKLFTSALGSYFINQMKHIVLDSDNTIEATNLVLDIIKNEKL